MMNFLKRNWLWILVLLFCVQLGVFMWWILRTEYASDIPLLVPEKTVSETFVDDVSKINAALDMSIKTVPALLAEELEASRLYLILSNKADSHDEQITQSFVLENGKLTDAEDQWKDELDFYYSYSPNEEKGVFFGVPKDKRAGEEKWTERASLYSFERSAVEGSPFPTIERSTYLGDLPLPNKQNPAISNTGEVLFVSHADPFGGGVDEAENWSISTVKNGQPLFVTYGFMPKWISDDEFVFLKNDGVHKGNFTDGVYTGELLIPNTSKNKVFNNNRIDVSVDGNTLVWMKPEESLVEIYKRSSAGAFALIGSISARGYWAAISPSGSFLALQTTNLSSNGLDPNPQPRIIFFDMNAFRVVEEVVIDLSAFDQLRMFMTEWVKK